MVSRLILQKAFFFHQATDLTDTGDEEIDQAYLQALHLFQSEGRLYERLFDHEEWDQARIIFGRFHDKLKGPNRQRFEFDPRLSRGRAIARGQNLCWDGDIIGDRCAGQ